MLDDVIFVWGTMYGGMPAQPPTVSVSAWPFLFGKQWSIWDTFDAKGVLHPEIKSAKVAFVNLFHTDDSLHIQQIRSVNPTCFIVAMPDPSLDMVLSHPEWMNMHRQMAMADMIGGRTCADCDVYGTLLNKPAVYLPSPIGDDDWFAQFRGLEKGDYLLTLDHQFAPKNSAYNVAAVAAIQRKTGIRVIYAAERDWTRDYAKLAGLDCEFRGHVSFREFVELTARARLCVDMYASHSYGRQQMLCGMVGTAVIASEWCRDAVGIKVDPVDTRRIVEWATRLLTDSPERNAFFRKANLTSVQDEVGFDASRARLVALLERIGVGV